MGTKLSVPSDAALSFFNSPYIGHSQQAAIDVYPSHERWYGPTQSPISGTIAQLRQIRMGRKKEFPTDEYDYAIGIIPLENPDIMFRILHCKPDVVLDQEVRVGDIIGSLIRSRYFNFWTDPHYHIEAMHFADFKRSSKSYNLENTLTRNSPISIYSGESILDSSWQVDAIKPDYMLLRSYDSEYGCIGDYVGHLASCCGKKGILDAGVPHYPHGGVHLTASCEHGNVLLGTTEIGYTKEFSQWVVLFQQWQGFRISINDQPIQGFSTYLFPKRASKHGKPSLKVIPLSYSGFLEKFEIDDSVSISIS
ncbi:MAG: hypothetical protein JW779_08765 [Candidatus Thorarchaeota archaeon]|nr:hypothetical protein [Candidatus Thorarchaeota archaeon]